MILLILFRVLTVFTKMILEIWSAFITNLWLVAIVFMFSLRWEFVFMTTLERITWQFTFPLPYFMANKTAVIDPIINKRACNSFYSMSDILCLLFSVSFTYHLLSFWGNGWGKKKKGCKRLGRRGNWCLYFAFRAVWGSFFHWKLQTDHQLPSWKKSHEWEWTSLAIPKVIEFTPVVLFGVVQNWLSNKPYQLAGKIKFSYFHGKRWCISNINMLSIYPPRIIIAVLYIFISLYMSCPPYCGYRFKYLRK